MKNLPPVREACVWSLGPDDSLEEEMATRSSVLAWRSPWIGEPGRLESMGSLSQRVQHDLANYTDNYSLVFLWTSNEADPHIISLKCCHIIFFLSQMYWDATCQWARL